MLGQKIKHLRMEHYLTETELAHRSGHPLSTIHGIESGFNQNPSFKTVRDIANVLGISLDELAKSID